MDKEREAQIAVINAAAGAVAGGAVGTQLVQSLPPAQLPVSAPQD